jgi:acetyl esterase/lipase
MAEEFHQALAAAGGEVQVLRVARRNHSSVMFHAVSMKDPVARAVVAFVWQHARLRP